MKRENERIKGGVLFEGIISVRTVISAMQSGGLNDRRITRVYVGLSRAEEQKKELAWLKMRGVELGFDVETVPESFIDGMAVGSSHGYIVAAATGRTLPSLDGQALAGRKFLAMLDGIEDPYNFGYALRSLYAAGCDGIVLGERNWMSASGIVARSSAGASELLDVFVSDPYDAATLLKREGFRIVCADMRQSVSVFDADLSFPLFLIVGGEKRGISRKVLETSDLKIRIDYGRDFDGSLSAASAATVAAFEILRFNREKIRQT
ncbi:MAG: RNA methyltransferase [Clostridia bacterium]|nr:RNA methyltransferase [Clostridia bacterium]